MANETPALQPSELPDSQTIFAALRDALASLYSAEQDARVVVDDAGLVAIQIAFSTRAQTNWHNILSAALQQQRLEVLLEVARNEYLDNEALYTAHLTYRRLIEQGGRLAVPPQPLEGGVTQTLKTSGGMVVAGSVTTSGDVIGRDQHIHGDRVQGDKVLGNKITYQQLPPPLLDAATLAAASARLVQLPTDAIPPITTLPPGSRMPFSANPLFVGREADLLQLAAALKGGETVAVGQITAATGLGGIGKTQLAVAFVHHYGSFFAGGVQWLSFANPDAIPAEIAACGAALPDGRADFAKLDLETQVRLVLAAWQSPLPRLLVFDNCEEPALLAQWRPPTGGSRVLVTSRRRAWDAALGVQLLALDTFDRAQSVELLRKFRPDLPVTDAPLDGIAAELGDLPLALHLAGSYLARYRYAVTATQYLTQLRQPDLLRHRSLQAGDLSPTGHVQHVARTFALSYEQLKPDNPPDTLARALLARAAWFAPGQLIPRSLLLASLERDEEEDDPLQTADTLEQLTNLGLLEMTGEGNILLHRLVAHFVQHADSAITKTAQQAVAATLLTAANRINHAGLPGPLLLWQSHLRHITDTMQSQTDEQAASLCNELGFHFNMIGDSAAARPYYARALAIREEVLGAKHPDTAQSLNNLGALLQAQGDYAAARPYFARALTIFEQRLGSAHPYTQTVRQNLAALP